MFSLFPLPAQWRVGTEAPWGRPESRGPEAGMLWGRPAGAGQQAGRRQPLVELVEDRPPGPRPW